ncbi:hypothetical protein BpHYR1_052644 [Brachionus plicatilis]|uniref:Uncharacterized protein n=1 Tax=Brachionus plicatilis TaxID=10195 RepID=A0A3M7S9U3_BRAPC|nr:hypothetical protein BpHYR1_052644 [Brachionus plicatilis]
MRVLKLARKILRQIEGFPLYSDMILSLRNLLCINIIKIFFLMHIKYPDSFLIRLFKSHNPDSSPFQNTINLAYSELLNESNNHLLIIDHLRLFLSKKKKTASKDKITKKK